MNIHSLGYAALCVLVPVAWGLVVYWVSSRIEARIFRDGANAPTSGDAPQTLPLDFHI